MYSYLRQRLKHAVRFRNKRGYGVHSPFMFNFILNVIRDRDRQFCYPVTLEKKKGLKHRERKIYRLLYRLIRYLKLEKVVCFGTKTDVPVAYLSDGQKDINIFCNQQDQMWDADFIYFGRDSQFFLSEEPIPFPINSGNQCVVIVDIYRDGFNAQLWRQAKEKATVSIDMMWYGILLFDEKLQKGKYNLII